MKSKNDVFNVFLKWKSMAETQTRKKIKHLRIDNGGEFCNDQFLKLCQDEGIVRHFIVIDTPQQNRVTKRMNQHCWRKFDACCLMLGWARNFGLML